MLDQWVYTSLLTVFEHDIERTVRSIAKASNQNNKPAGITGCLLVDGRRVVQFLEGPKAALEDLRLRLDADQRHAEMQTLYRGESDQREIPKWGMATYRIEPTDIEAEDLHDITRAAQEDGSVQLGDYLDVMRRYIFDGGMY